MKSKILLSASLLAVAFIFSSYINFQSAFSNQYESINTELVGKTNTTVQVSTATSCAKCHDCSGQNSWVDTQKVESKPKVEESASSINTGKRELESKYLLSIEEEEVETTLYPDTFKNIQIN